MGKAEKTGIGLADIVISDRFAIPGLGCKPNISVGYVHYAELCSPTHGAQIAPSMIAYSSEAFIRALV